jgi:hypothetical protein
MATMTNISQRRFYSKADGGFCLMPDDSKQITTQHALCYLGNNQLEVVFTYDDDFSNISELRLLSLKRTLNLDENLSVKDIISLYMPKKKTILPKPVPKKSKKPKE